MKSPTKIGEIAMKKKMVALSALAMLYGVGAWAGKPEQLPAWSSQVIGEEVANCGDFLVLSDYTVDAKGRAYLNKDGSLSRLFFDFDVPQSIYYNSEDASYWLPGTAEHIQQWFHFAEGEALTHIVTIGAAVRVILPGYGPVLMGIGRLKLDVSTGELTFTGQFDQFNGNLDAICAALRP